MSGDGEEPLSAVFKKSNKVKKPSLLRRTLALDEAEGDKLATIVRPKRPLQAQRVSSASSRPSTPSLEKRSLYSSDYLNQLRSSTPTTPIDYVAIHDNIESQEASDLSYHATELLIPEEGLIRHVKEQREVRRQAGENYIPLTEALSLTGRDAHDYGSRLQTEDDVDTMGHGDEAMAGFEDEQLPLGKRSTKAAEVHKKVEIQELIDDAEGDYPYIPDDVLAEHTSDSDDEWETTQVRKSGGALQQNTVLQASSSITIPSLDEILAQLESKLVAAKAVVAEKQATLQAIQSQQADIARKEVFIQESLNILGKRHTHAV